MDSKAKFINEIIKTFNFKSYVEIGVYAASANFNQIEAEKKYSVDPNPLGDGGATHPVTSDEFFANNTEKYDVIFIDGLHHDDQVERDIKNSLAVLNPGGVIVVHDCNPPEEIHQRVPAESSYWVGTVWKAWVRLQHELPPEVEMFMVNFDTGIGVIKVTGNGRRLEFIPESELTFQNLEMNRDHWLNIVSLDYFLNWLHPVTKVKVETPTIEVVSSTSIPTVGEIKTGTKTDNDPEDPKKRSKKS